jgi:cytoskeletal protein RodZ
MLKRLIMYGLYGLAVISLLVGIVIAFRAGKNTDEAPQTKPGTQISQSGTQSSSKSNNQSKSQSSNSTNGSSTSNSSNSSSAPQAAPAPSTSSSSATANSQAAQAQAQANANANGKLTNTGPGETALLFVSTVAAGLVAFSVYQRRKLTV